MRDRGSGMAGQRIEAAIVRLVGEDGRCLAQDGGWGTEGGGWGVGDGDKKMVGARGRTGDGDDRCRGGGSGGAFRLKS